MFNIFKRKKSQENDNPNEEIITSEEVVTEEVVEETVEAEGDEAEAVVEEVEETIEETIEEAYETEITDEIAEEPAAEATEELAEEIPSEKGFFAKLKAGLEKTRNSFGEKLDDVFKMFKNVDEELFEELEEALIMADVGVETSLYIIEELRTLCKERKVTESSEVKGLIKEIISNILTKESSEMKLNTNPSVIMVIGVNGVGKTTSIGKIASHLKAQGKKVILGAGDTFRAAAIDQLKIWADRAGLDIISHQEGSDPGAVMFDTIEAAKSRGADVIIFDTAGRLHNKKNLMDELNKIFRIMDRELPDCDKEILLVLDATTGQNAVNQAKLFGEATNITGIVLTKLDGTAKGGIVIAIGHEQNLPVKYVGVGEGMYDLQLFDAENFADALFED